MQKGMTLVYTGKLSVKCDKMCHYKRKHFYISILRELKTNLLFLCSKTPRLVS